MLLHALIESSRMGGSTFFLIGLVAAALWLLRELLIRIFSDTNKRR